MIGVTKPYGAETEKVRLTVYGKTCFYIESKPLHGSQKTKWNDSYTMDIELDLIINYELEKEILSYGEHIKVVSPKRLAERMINHSVNLIDLYNDIV